MKRAKRLVAVSVLGVALAMLVPAVHANGAKGASTALRPPVCLIPPCPTDTPTADPGHSDHGDKTPDPATPTADAGVTLHLATPIPTPSLKDSGFAESRQVTQQDLNAPKLTRSGPPPAIANYASAPGFASIGVPLLLLFSLLGSGAFFVRRRL